MKSVNTHAERAAFLAGWLGSVLCIVGLVLWVDQRHGAEGMRELGTLALLSLFAIGKFVIFANLHQEAPLPPAGLAFMVWAVDCFWAFAIVGGLSQMTSVPILGNWLSKARNRARVVLTEYPRLEAMAFWGVSLLVFLPIAATGAVTGSFAAQLVGLPRLVGVGAVALGSAVTGLLFALLAHFIGERAEDILRSPVLAALSVSAMLLFCRFAYLRVRDKLR